MLFPNSAAALALPSNCDSWRLDRTRGFWCSE